MNTHATPFHDRLLIIAAQEDELRSCFSTRFSQVAVASVDRALEEIHLLRPHLILLSTILNEGDGLDLCRHIRQSCVNSHAALVMLCKSTRAQSWTADLRSDPCAPLSAITTDPLQHTTQQAIAAGATDCFVALLNLALIHTRCEAYILCVREVKRHIRMMRLTALNVVMDLVGGHDQNTGAHIQRTIAYVQLLCEALCQNPRYTAALTPAAIEWIALAAPLHDIGKISVPEQLLQKNGALSASERIIMQTHPLSGMLALDVAEKLHTGPVEFFRFAKEIALSHHEKWDGSGYPLGLKGDQIPLSAQLVAVADAYDALRSHRSYKPAQPHEVAVTQITASSGTHFSPAVVDAFLAKATEFSNLVIGTAPWSLS